MVINNLEVEAEIERVDDLPLLYGLLKRIEVQAIIDEVIEAHGNWQGVSPGWVMTVWLMHILSEKNHLMEPVEKWVGKHRKLLRRLTGQKLRKQDFTDDKLALCLRYLQKEESWYEIESRLGQQIIRVYELTVEIIRLDATVGSVYHNPENHELFKIGKAKNGLYGPQFKLKLGSIDPLGLPIALDVVPGNRADDPLYVPIYKRIKEIVKGIGKLIVGDCKMSPLGTRAAIVQGKDSYLMPLAHAKDEPNLLDELLDFWSGRAADWEVVFLPEDLPEDGSASLEEHAIASGFEFTRERRYLVDGEEVIWNERLLVVRSKAYVKTMQEGLNRRLDKAEAALRDLTPESRQGKQQIRDEASLLVAIDQIERKHRVQGLFHRSYTQKVTQRPIRKYKDNPARVERTVRFQMHVTRNQAAIDQAHFRAGWRIYATNASCQTLSLSAAVLAYRDQYIAENVFRRLHGKFLSITPLYIQRDDHAKGLFHLLSIAARLLALGDYQAKKALAEQGRELAGIFDGDAQRSTSTPTTERMLKAFDNIHLLILETAQQATHLLVTPLTSVQQDILALLDLPTSLYTDLQCA